MHDRNQNSWDGIFAIKSSLSVFIVPFISSLSLSLSLSQTGVKNESKEMWIKMLACKSIASIREGIELCFVHCKGAACLTGVTRLYNAQRPGYLAGSNAPSLHRWSLNLSSLSLDAGGRWNSRRGRFVKFSHPSRFVSIVHIPLPTDSRNESGS